jgi:hypothetical protein
MGSLTKLILFIDAWGLLITLILFSGIAFLLAAMKEKTTRRGCSREAAFLIIDHSRLHGDRRKAYIDALVKLHSS